MAFRRSAITKQRGNIDKKVAIHALWRARVEGKADAFCSDRAEEADKR